MLTNIFKKLEKFKENSNEAIADWCGELNFQVRGFSGQYTVDLGGMTCSCKKWDLCGIPCTHTIAAIANRKHAPEDYVNECYSKETYAKAYHPLIMPINGYQMWPKIEFTPVLPPLEKRKLGRPKMARRRDLSEYISKKDPTKLRRIGQNSVFCRKCGKHGHNRRTCIYNVEDESTVGDEELIGVGRGTRDVRGRGTSNVRGRGTRDVRGRGTSDVRSRGTSIGVGRGTSNARGRGRSIGVGRGTSNARGRGTSIGVGRGTSNARGCSQPVEGQSQGTRVGAQGLMRGCSQPMEGGFWHFGGNFSLHKGELVGNATANGEEGV
ncbi:hypothetical protein Vadar_006536 [Vaccinium darrowii]|uniref:Uncharacterized protein n=1 Tax=Vaccinium darrowii TaxID=229202 RepID=A0ACB7XX17_9ERIC|nr:hypothetical protein Vadar_006536 [Vaccinium darrowii]